VSAAVRLPADMPVTFRLRRDHLGAPYFSETNFVTISGKLEIGGVSRGVLSDQTSRFRWSIAIVGALERAWLD
jgi:hypothetical protein